MNPTGLYVQVQTAEETLDRLVKLAAASFSQDRVELQFQTNVNGIGNNSITNHAHVLAQDDNLKRLRSTIENRPYLICTNAHLKVNPQQGNNFLMRYTTPDAIVAQITFENAHPQNDAARIQTLINTIAKEFSVTSYIDLIKSRGEPAEQAALQIRERSLADLQTAVAQLAKFQTEQMQREIESRRAREEELDKSHRERLDALEKEYRERQAASDAQSKERDDALAARERDFKEQVSAFDTHQARYTRRKLLAKIEEVLKESETLKLSTETNQKRSIIHRVTGLLMAFSLFVAIAALAMLYNTHDLRLLFPLGAASLTFVSTVIYYLRWNDRWFREHADAEFAAKRYKADIVRASWVAELVAEMGESKVELPEQLVDAFTRSLFNDTGPSRVTEHPFDELTGLMKRARRLSVGGDGFNLRLGAKADEKKPEGE